MLLGFYIEHLQQVPGSTYLLLTPCLPRHLHLRSTGHSCNVKSSSIQKDCDVCNFISVACLVSHQSQVPWSGNHDRENPTTWLHALEQHCCLTGLHAMPLVLYVLCILESAVLTTCVLDAVCECHCDVNTLSLPFL